MKLGARAEEIAETAYKTAAILNKVLLPNRSLSGPETIIARVAVSVRELTAQPNSILVSSNSASINFITPEITDASNPISKLPNATVRAIPVMLFLLFIMFK